MMADSVEAASRSLKEHSTEKIDALVEGIINNQRSEGQFDEAPITFAEINSVKKVFKQRLQSLYHNRVSYPENED
jgi:membrane-associated HD superfamily phosphohydrolase